MSKEELLEQLSNQFRRRIEIIEKRAGIYQLLIPVYHEDGDMIELFVDSGKSENGTIRLCDFGMGVMRLSYSYDIDTENKEKIFHKILSENGLQEENGNVYLDTSLELLYPSVLQFSQGIAKVCSMRFFKREVIESLFYEMLDEFIMEKLVKYRPTKTVLPIEARDDLEVDYQFQPNGKPLYLFGVKDPAKARIATISCLEFQRASLTFESMIVHEDSEKLPRKDRKRLTSACDKQFPSLDDFKQNAEQYLERAAR
ncbi:MAG: DUF1828 domain-containing protein [Ignavibacteriae bacterium]|nr:DUF1828 domain-containing protein [Ignavibacteriota bacterium]